MWRRCAINTSPKAMIGEEKRSGARSAQKAVRIVPQHDHNKLQKSVDEIITGYLEYPRNLDCTEISESDHNAFPQLSKRKATAHITLKRPNSSILN